MGAARLPGPWPRQAQIDALAACGRAPDPEAARAGFVRLAEQRATPPANGALPDLALVFGASPFLTDLLLTEPELLDAAWSGRLDRELPTAAGLGETCAAALDLGALARAKRRELFRIALVDLARRAETPLVLAALSDLADAVCQRLYELELSALSAEHGLPVAADGDGAEDWTFCVLGMGKLGARELNFSSDIDLIFLHCADRARTRGATELSGHEFAVRLARRLIKALSVSGPAGPLYRVDLRLRPMGRSGEAATSLRSAEVYYESWGETWERQAMLRARPCAGGIELGRRLIEMLRPFVFRRYLDYQALEALGAIKDRLQAGLSEAARRGDDVKMSPGAIRELEFAVQSLQLIHGGRDKSLRSASTFDALAALARGGYLNETQAEALRRAYLFLRELENRLQMYGNLQTQELPTEPRRLTALARLMGVTVADDGRAVQELRGLYDGQRSRVSEIYEALMPRARTTRTARGAPLSGPEWAGRRETLKRLADAGFRDPLGSYRALMAVREDPAEPESAATRELFAQLAPEFVERAAEGADPDAALQRLERFVTARGNRSTLFKRLWSRQREIDLLLRALGDSAFLAGLLVAHPELATMALRRDALLRARGIEIARSSIDAFLETADDPAGRERELGRARRANELAIGLRDLLLAADVRQVCLELSHLAQACVESALDLARERLSERRDVQPGDLGGFAVLALGSLGPGELTFNADLDLLFVYEPTEYDEQGMRRRAARVRLAETLISLLGPGREAAPIYRVDARLRPNGAQGLIAVPGPAAAAYFSERAAPFERQALLRLRLLAGDSAVAQPLLRIRERLLFSAGWGRDDLEACARIRERYLSESPAGDQRLDIKLGRGGLLDAEYGVQLLALAHGHAVPGLRRLSTLDVLSAALQSGLLDRPEHDALRAGWLTLKAVENKLRLTYERPRHVLPEPGSIEAAFLARLLEWPDQARFYSYLRRVRAECERAYLAVLDRLGIDVRRGD